MTNGEAPMTSDQQDASSSPPPLINSDHSVALVPLGAGYHQSTDVFALGRSVDTGLLAESLIYYDRVFINVDNPVRFAELTSRLIQQGLSPADLTALFREGVLQVYDFSFSTNPFVDFQGPDSIQIHGLYNIQDSKMQKTDSFFERYVEFDRLRDCFSDHKQFDEFARALEGRVIEIKADEIGASAINNAYEDFLNPKRNALMAQQLVNEIYRIRRLGKPPEVQATVTDNGEGRYTISWNIKLNELPAVEVESNIVAAATLPLSTAAQANKYLWAADKEKCDLFLAQPVSILVGDKLFEVGEAKSKAKTKNIIEELELSVAFPDLRAYINSDRIDFDKVLEIRTKAKKFRGWLQSEVDRDRDAIIAYHDEVANDSGFSNLRRRTIKLFGVLGAAAARVGVKAVLGTHDPVTEAVVSAGVSEGIKYLADLAADVGGPWKPVVFGKWYNRKIERLLKEDME